jgi:hypothetical protein
MNKKILKKGLLVGIILLFVGVSIVPGIYGNSTILQSQYNNNQKMSDKGKILIYATWSYYAWNGYDKSHFSELAQILEDYEYSVTLTDRSETPTITDSLLSNYYELWIINSEYDWSGSFTQTEITTILNYRNEGNGLVINADNIDPLGGGFAHTANQISIPLGVTFYGSANHGGPSIQPDFEQHPLFVGVTTIHGDANEARLSINTPAKDVATYQDDYIIAVLEAQSGSGRVVFDNTIARFLDGGNNVLIGDTPKYVKNIADWVNNQPPTTPTINGPTKFFPNIYKEFTFLSTDPDGDQIYYYIEWGDGSIINWQGPYPSGTPYKASHKWVDKATFTIKCKAKGINGAESDFGTLDISTPRCKILNLDFLVILQSHLNFFPILQKLLNRLGQ